MKILYTFIFNFSLLKKGAILSKIKLYYKQAKDELNKVIFPIKEQVKSAYLSVFVVVTIISLFLALIDAIMSLGLTSIMN